MQRAAQRHQSHTNHAGRERGGDERHGHPKGSAQNGARMQAVPETAGIRNQSSNRCAERDTGLLHRGDGRGSNVFLAAFRPSHDALKDESPANADTDADQRDWQQQDRSRPGRHQQTDPKQTRSHGDRSRNYQSPRPFAGERRDGELRAGPGQRC
jgi:hypothetical protein